MAIELQKVEIFCGIARLPREMASMDPNSYLAVEIAVNGDTSVIEDVVCTSFPILGERMIHDYLVGKPVSDTLEPLQALLETRYHGLGKPAMIAALGNVAACYTSNSGNSGNSGNSAGHLR